MAIQDVLTQVQEGSTLQQGIVLARACPDRDHSYRFYGGAQSTDVHYCFQNALEQVKQYCGAISDTNLEIVARMCRGAESTDVHYCFQNALEQVKRHAGKVSDKNLAVVARMCHRARSTDVHYCFKNGLDSVKKTGRNVSDDAIATVAGMCGGYYPSFDLPLP